MDRGSPAVPTAYMQACVKIHAPNQEKKETAPEETVQRISRLAVVSICALVILGAQAVVPSAQTPAAQPLSAADGTITVTWGDPLPDAAGSPRVLVHLNTAAGAQHLLTFAPGVLEQAGGLTAVHMRDAHIEGLATAGDGVTSGYLVSSLRLFPRAAADPEPAVTGAQPWVDVLCKFSDKPAEPKPPSYFQDLMSGNPFGLDHYWREVSYDLANIAGSAVTSWVTLPQPRAYYVPPGSSANLSALANDCANAGVAAGVNFPSYVGINFVFNDTLDCCAWGGGRTMTLNGVTKAYRTTWMPSWSYSQGVFAHEMGHGFGLPHSSGPYGNTYDSNWDPMSNTYHHSHPTFQYVVPHTISYHKDILGWIPPARKFVAPPNSTQTITIERIGQPTANGTYLMAQIQFGASATTYYTVEARRFSGYDVYVPGEAIVLHSVVPGRSVGTPGSPANVVDVDGNGNPNDAGAMWLPGEIFVDSANGVAVRVNSVDATSFSVTITRGALISLGTNAVTFGRQGGMRSVGVSASVPWTASGDPWIGVSPASGTGSGAVNISVGPSATYRRGTVTIGGQSVIVSQPGVAGDLTGGGRANIAVYRPTTGQWYVNGVPGSTLWGGQRGDIPVAADYNGDGTAEVAIFRPSTGAWYLRDGTLPATAPDVVTWGRLGDLPVPGDYNGDGRADIAVYRPSTGTWYVKDQFSATWGRGGDIPVQGDYNGDGVTDVAVFRRATGTWYVRNVLTTVWGAPGDLPVPADYDGNGTTDVAVFRPGAGAWYVKDGVAGSWGAGGDVPLPLDFTGDGRADFGVFRAATGNFYIYNPVNGTTQTVAWGLAGDVPVVPRPLLPGIAAGDTEGDGRPEMTVYRPSTGIWWTLQSSTGFSGYTNPLWGGQPDDQPALSDFDGDGKADYGIFRPALGRWFLLQSSTGGGAMEDWGMTGDVAVPGDYRGAGQSQVAVFRPSTGRWYIRNGPTVEWGLAGDVTVPADYDGDGRTDVAVFRPSGPQAGNWYVKTSSSEFTSYVVRSWGLANDIPVPADYDGDRRADFAVFRPSTGTFVVLLSTTNYTSYVTHTWGASGDIPVVGDYNGDGVIDIAVFRPSIGRWYVKDFITRDWGVNNDVPFPQRPQ